MGIFNLFKPTTFAQEGQEYHQKERDEQDMISYIRVIEVDNEKMLITYRKHYKPHIERPETTGRQIRANSLETCTFIEFNRNFRKGR